MWFHVSVLIGLLNKLDFYVKEIHDYCELSSFRMLKGKFGTTFGTISFYS